MAKITSYPFDNRISGDDTLLGTDTSTRQTSQFSISSIQSFIIENGDVIVGTGTKDTIPIFTDFQGTVGDSIITYNNTITPAITVGGRLVVTGDLIVNSRSTFTGYAKFNGPVRDATNSSGTAGQVLSSTGTGTVEWASATGLGIGGSGTINTIPLFTGATTLGDSQITQDALGQEVIVGTRLKVENIAVFEDEVIFEDEVVFEGQLDVQDILLDGSGDAGAAGQLLSSTGTGTAWVDSTSTDLKQADVIFSKQSMLSLNGGGTLTLLQAPGAGKLLAVLNVILYVDYNTTTYNFVNTGISDNISFYVGSDQSRGINTTILNSTSDKYVSYDFPNSDVNSDIQPNVSFSIQSSSGVTVSTGDSPVKFSILYREVVLP